MHSVKVLGSGCANCERLAALAGQALNELGRTEQVEKVTDYAAIASYGIASTPGIVINGKVVHVGGLPKSEDLARWLTT